MIAKITSGQRKQIKRFVEDGLDGFNLTKEDAQSLIAQGGVFQAQLKEAVVALLKKGKFPSQTLDANLIPNGWEIVEDVEPSKFQIKDLEMVSFLENGEEYVKGEVLRKRAVGLKANLGLADAKYILDYQAEIPPEFRTKYFVFPGTLLRSPDGDLRVAYLGWDGERWCHNFNWVDVDFSVSDRLVRSK